jgi:hypothetical protein
MPQFNLLLLPLLGGFIFASLWHPTKYYTQRADTYRLIFTASVTGAVFLFLACVIVSLLTYLVPSVCQPINRLWHDVFPYANSGRATLAFAMGAFLWWPANKKCSDTAAVSRAILSKRDPLELLLRRALGEVKLVSVTLKSGKVYVGTIQSNFNPAYPMEHVSMLPAFSGYRDKITKKMELTLSYFEALKPAREKLLEIDREILQMLDQEISKENMRKSQKKLEERKNILQDYEVVLPIDELQSVNIFHVNLYKRQSEFTLGIQSDVKTDRSPQGGREESQQPESAPPRS